MADIDISLSEQEKAFLDSQVVEGRYANASDYIADLIRADAQRQLRTLVGEGLAGPHRDSSDELWAEIRRAGSARLTSGK